MKLPQKWGGRDCYIHLQWVLLISSKHVLTVIPLGTSKAHQHALEKYWSHCWSHSVTIFLGIAHLQSMSFTWPQKLFSKIFCDLPMPQRILYERTYALMTFEDSSVQGFSLRSSDIWFFYEWPRFMDTFIHMDMIFIGFPLSFSFDMVPYPMSSVISRPFIQLIYLKQDSYLR